MDPPPPPLPWGQVALMIFSWTSFFFYSYLIVIILLRRRAMSILSSPFYSILVYNAIGDLALFFHVEIVMRPRKFRFFTFFDSSTPLWFAYYSYFLSAFLRTVMQLGYIPMAVNRFTAFIAPMSYDKIWKSRNIVIFTIIIWIVAFLIVLNMFIWEEIDMSWKILPSGVMQTLANRYFYLDAIVSTTVSLCACILCSVLYIVGALRLSKVDCQQSAIVERKLYKCSIFSSIPLLVEAAKSLVLLWATIENNQDLLVFLTEFWFYWTEFMSVSQCWILLIVTPSVRKLMFDVGWMFRKESVRTITGQSRSTRMFTNC